MGGQGGVQGDRKCILGDKDPKPLEWVKKMHKPVAEMRVADWKETVEECDGKCIYLMDPPHGMISSGTCQSSDRPGCVTDKDYFPVILEFCRRHECLINIPILRKEELCRDIVCHEFDVELWPGKTFRYVIGDTRRGAKPTRWSGTFRETERKA